MLDYAVSGLIFPVGIAAIHLIWAKAEEIKTRTKLMRERSILE